MPSVDFDEAKHEYTHGGVKLVSVTEVLREVGIVDGNFYTERGRTVGTFAHRACRMASKGSLDREGLDPELNHYVQAWELFCHDKDYRPMEWERPLRSDFLSYAGTFDTFGLWSGDEGGHHEFVLIDLKCNAAPKWAGLQLAGYEQLLVEDMGDHAMLIRRRAVVLHANGRYSCEKFDSTQDRKVFNAALAVTLWKRSKR